MGETPFVTALDDRFDYGEDRYITVGVLKGRVVFIAHTEHADTIRIISARYATARESRKFYEEIGRS